MILCISRALKFGVQSSENLERLTSNLESSSVPRFAPFTLFSLWEPGYEQTD